MKIRCRRREWIAMRASERVFGAVVMLTVLLDVFLRGFTPVSERESSPPSARG
jgi:hypothetical protein